MEPSCIRHSELPGASRLFLDFSYHFDKVSSLYPHNPHSPAELAQVAREISYPDDRRAALVKALEGQNGPSESLALLAKPGTVAVITGQQVGLFSGPSYTIYKAMTAARVARELNAQGVAAVPIFWLATEDHDFPEVNHAWVFGPAHKPVKVAADAPASIAGKHSAGKQLPVGGIPIEKPPIEELRNALRGFANADEVVAMVERAYKPGATMGSGFQALLKQILQSLGLIFIDPLDPAIRKIAAPFMAEALAAAPELKAKLLEKNKELASLGYHAQVHIEPKTSLFFLMENGERTTLRHKDSEYAQFQDRAADISPNALLRPVMQDYLMPTVAYVGGPAELAYFAQSRVLYDTLLGRMPVVMSRSGFTLLDARAEKLLTRYKLTIPQTLVYEESLKERIAGALLPMSLEGSFDAAAGDIERNLNHLRGQIAALDKTLAAALDKSKAKITYQLQKTRKKVSHELLRRDAHATSDADYLRGLLYPHKHLQERFYSILPFLAKHGAEVLGPIFDAVRTDCPDHRVLTV
jgi:bacillithiol biosynthesis cysteine-adding enzyme BshC